jgi:hypothetical protein
MGSLRETMIFLEAVTKHELVNRDVFHCVLLYA